MRRRSVVAVVTILVAAMALRVCRDGVAGRGHWVRDGDTVMRDVQPSGSFEDRTFNEASGVAPSLSEPGVFWGNNDSGNDERLFAFDRAGRRLGDVRVRNVQNRDWEALAGGPCVDDPGARCLYIGDVGDNGARRDKVVLYALREPSQRSGQVSALRTLDVRDADGPHDVEAMYAGPNGTLWLVTKRPERAGSGRYRPSRVYEVPASAWGAGGPYVARIADSVSVTPVTGASNDRNTDGSLSDIQTDGTRRQGVLSYGAVHVFSADAVTGKPGPLLARCALPIADTAAEGVSWLPDGRILLVNEGKAGALYTGRCP
ncbi:MAG: hypothetical protein ACK5AK_05170 [Gemmatimonas sp.]